MLSEFIDYLRFAVETIIAGMILSMGLQRRKTFSKFLLFSVVILAGCCLINASLANSFVQKENVIAMAGMYAVLSLEILGVLALLFSGSEWNLLFSFINGSMLRMCSRKLFDISVAWFARNSFYADILEKGQPTRYFLYYVIMILVYLSAWLLFGKKYQKSTIYHLHKGFVTVYILMLTANFLLNRIEPVLKEQSLVWYTELAFCEVIYYALMLAVQYVLFCMTQKEIEAVTAKELWRKDRLQYEQSKENIEAINIKCHDLRHHIREIQEHDQSSRSAFLDEVASSISIYDSIIKTGNNALDVVLSEKRLRCEKEKIQITTMADGTALCGMDDSDIYALFGNLLDNAIEYEATLADPENDLSA